MMKRNYRFKRVPRSSKSCVQQSNAYSVREVIEAMVRDKEFIATQAKMGTYDKMQSPEEASSGSRPKADLDAPRPLGEVSRRAAALHGIDAFYPPGVAEKLRTPVPTAEPVTPPVTPPVSE